MLLRITCTNNQSNMKFAIRAIGATYIEASGDSLWVVQYISEVYQCFDESLIIYHDTCLDANFILNYSIIAHIFRHENWRATSWLNKHQTTMLLMVYPIFHKSRWFILPTSVRPDWSSPLRPLMNNLVQVETNIGRSPLLTTCKILAKG